MRGRSLSLLLLAVGAVLVAAGVAVVVGFLSHPAIGAGVGGALLGAEMLLAGLFLVPTDAARRDRSGGGL